MQKTDANLNAQMFGVHKSRVNGQKGVAQDSALDGVTRTLPPLKLALVDRKNTSATCAANCFTTTGSLPDDDEVIEW